MIRRSAALALLVAGCQPELPPASEQDVVPALVESVVVPMGNVVVISRPSECGGTKVAVPPAAWAAFVAANEGNRAGIDLGAHASRLRLDAGEGDAEAIRARRRMPVVSLSRIGIAGDEALLCVEVYGAGDRGFYLLFRRDGAGRWSLYSEFDAWEEPAQSWELPPEQMPDGRAYEG